MQNRSLHTRTLTFAVAALVATFGAGFSTTASAAVRAEPEQDADSAARAGSNDAGDSVYNFEADNLQGELLKPDGSNVTGQGAIKHASLIKIRTDFLAELVTLAMDV